MDVRGEDDRDKGKQNSEAAFGTQSATMGGATMGGSFWMFGAKMTETNGNKLFFSRDSEAGVWHPKCNHGRLVLDQN